VQDRGQLTTVAVTSAALHAARQAAHLKGLTIADEQAGSAEPASGAVAAAAVRLANAVSCGGAAAAARAALLATELLLTAEVACDACHAISSS